LNKSQFKWLHLKKTRGVFFQLIFSLIKN